MKKVIIIGSAMLLVSFFTVGCGNNGVPAVPPPTSQYPNGYAGGGSCGGAIGSGAPLHPDGSPYSGTLMPVSYQGSSSNSLSLYLSYYTAMNADNNVQSIVGTGTFNFADMAMFMPGGTSSGISTAICVSSANPQSGNVSPGVYSNGGTVSLVLDGYMQTPAINPYSGYPGSTGYNYTQTPIEVAIGTMGGAGLYQSRIEGSIVVTINAGNTGAIQLQYQSQ